LKNNEEGVLAYITANTFLDTALFRGMRYELLRRFDEIHIINLHGSSKREEKGDENRDECIFKIQVGVSINVFIKKKIGGDKKLARVFYKDIENGKTAAQRARA
jgi:predicted helicase